VYQNRQALAFGSVILLLISAVILVVLSFWVWPKYNLYRMEMHGMAALKEAEWSKQILIEEAKAKEAASLMQANARVTLAEAEGKAQVVRAKAEGLADIERAKAAAESNRIIGDSLKGNDEYLRYIWIKGLQEGKGERIYIPTEAGLPILEAGKAGK
jgi:lipopolysaccharide export LptBFGC system permease protein LptF